MRQLPILFYAPMVRAILKGIKTNTRRVVRPQPIFDGVFWRLGDAAWSRNVKSVPAVPYHSLAARSPYGANGDRLWVRGPGGALLRVAAPPAVRVRSARGRGLFR